MDSTTTVRELCVPRRWRSVGKYLFPVGLQPVGWRRTPSAKKQVRVSELAREYPEEVKLHTLGAADTLPEFPYDCYTAGQREQATLQSRFVAPAFVAEIENGQSFGRHCCVIGPKGKAVRETGFYLDAEVLSERKAVSHLRLKYWRKRWEGDVTSRPWLPPKRRVDGRVAVLNTRFSHNFYHWLIDILPRLATLRRVGMEADYYLVDCLSPFQQNVLRTLGIETSQLIQPHCQLLLEASQLIVPSLPTPACLRELSSMLLTSLGADAPVTSGKRTYISRSKTGTRTLENELELANLLDEYGFETHSMEEYTLNQQARIIRESEIVVATHGAGLANLLFARPQTQVIEIVPAGRYNATCYPEKSRIFGLDHQLIFADRARHKQILSVELDDVHAALATAISATATPIRLAA